MYQLRVFHNLELANVWLSDQPDISIVDYKLSYTPYDVLVISILYKTLT